MTPPVSGLGVGPWRAIVAGCSLILVSSETSPADSPYMLTQTELQESMLC